MLKYFTGLDIIWYCYYHFTIVPFRSVRYHVSHIFPDTASAAAVSGAVSITQGHISAFDMKGKTQNDGHCQFFSGAVIDVLYGGSCHLHLLGTLILRKSLKTNEPDRFVFVQHQHDAAHFIGSSFRPKCHTQRFTADPAFFERSRHDTPPFS